MEAPKEDICFNGSIAHNDGLLANSIARKRVISYDEACLMMEEGVEQLIEALALHGEVKVGSLGTLRLNEESAIEFSPLHTAMQRSRRLGMPTLMLEGINVADGDNRATGAEVYPKSRFIIIPRSVARAAAAIAILIIGALSFLLPEVVPAVDTDYASVVPLNIASSAMEEVRAGQEFSIVVASFATMEKARDYVATNSYSDVELQVVPAYGRYRVVAMRGASAEELLDIMEHDDFGEIFPGCWIWERR